MTIFSSFENSHQQAKIVSQISRILGAIMSPFSGNFLLLLYVLLPSCLPARTIMKNNNWHKFHRFQDAPIGHHVSNISQLKTYFHKFGYLSTLLDDHEKNISDVFDAQLRSAVIHYQQKLGLQVTGKLDFDTVSQITAPRCGVKDTMQAMHATKHYVFFPGKPRWTRKIPITLTYAFSSDNMIKYLSLNDIKNVFNSAFAKWASVIPVSFSETENYTFADIKIGFYSGDHGDGEPFDGVLGVLAHAFSPESGKFHLDADETWAVDFTAEKSKVAVDLESVVTHEIGHILGLGHSSVKGSIMYPSLKPGDKRVDLMVDDIQGVQGLYGSNPNSSFGLLESDLSSNQAVDLSIMRWGYATWLFLLVFTVNCFQNS